MKSNLITSSAPEVDPYKALKEAYENGETIQCLFDGSHWTTMDIGKISWTKPIEEYRIKPDAQSSQN